MKSFFTIVLFGLIPMSTCLAQGLASGPAFTINETVLDPSIMNYGKVVGIFDNGQLAVKITYRRQVVTDTTDPEVKDSSAFGHVSGQFGGFTVGDGVIDSAGRVGQVLGIFDNGRLVVRFDYSPEVQDASQLAHHQ